MNICVYGAASPKIADIYIKKGEEFGKMLAKRGHQLVYGSGATGMMGAVSRGVQSEGGFVTGIVPEFFNGEERINFTCDRLFRPRTMRERKQMLECESDAFVVTPGGMGTYDEFFEMITLKQLGRHNKPIVFYNINGYFDSLLKALDDSIAEGFINKECREMYPAFTTPEEVFEYIENYTKMDLTKMKK